MKRKFLKALFLALAAIIVVAVPVLAYTYRATYTVTNSSATSYTMLAVNATANVTWLAANGFIQSDGLDTRVETLGGVVKPHMLTTNKILTAIPSAASSQTNLYFTTGNSDLTSMSIITGYGGNITTSDYDNLEPGDNFSHSMIAYLLNSGTFQSKSGALSYSYDTATQNVTAGFPVDRLSSDYFTDVGAKILVNTANGRLEYESEASAVDTRTYRDVGLLSNTEWSMSFAWNNTSGAGAGRTFHFGMTSNNTQNINVYTEDAVLFTITNNNAFITRYDAGAGATSGTIAFVDGTTYYVNLSRYSATNVALSIYTNVAMTTHLAGSPVTLVIPATVTGLRYIEGSNVANGAGAAIEQIGWIDNLFATGLPIVGATKTGVAAGERQILTTDNATNFYLQIDGGVAATSNATRVPNNSSSWIFGANNVAPYINSINMTVAGNPQLRYEPIAIISGTTLPDRGIDATSNPGTINWGDNPTNVSVSLGGMVSSAQPDPSIVDDSDPRDTLPEVEVSDWFVEPDVSGTLLTNPLRPLVLIWSDNSTLTELQVWRFYGFIFILGVAVATNKVVRGHLGIVSMVSGVAIGAVVAMTIWPFWALVFAIGAFFGGLILERTGSY